MLRRDGQDDVAEDGHVAMVAQGDGVRCGVERGHAMAQTDVATELDHPRGGRCGQQCCQIAARQYQVAMVAAPAECGADHTAENPCVGQFGRGVERRHAQGVPQRIA